MQPLSLNELTLEQKIGMALMGASNNEQFEYALALVRRRAIGTLWIAPSDDGSHRELIRKIREEADYPVLIISDMESGYGPYSIGHQYALGVADDPDLTYRFARAMAAAARADGYSGICSPILERGVHNIWMTRGFGGDQYHTLKHARAFIKGFLDAGILPICKHYPSSENIEDTHLVECADGRTEEEIVNSSLYTWIELNKEGLLKGMMTGHSHLAKVDAEHPTTVSKKAIDLIRSRGFDGYAITDDLSMLGICAKYGEDRYALALNAGNDVLLEWRPKNAEDALRRAVAEGVLTEARLDEVAERVIRAQNFYLEMPEYTLTPEDARVADEVNRRSIAALTDDGFSPAIDPNGRHLFIVLRPSVPAYFNPVSYDPEAIEARIRMRFPNAEITGLHEYPSNLEMYEVSHAALDYDSVVMVLYTEPLCYTGGECLTSRVAAMVGSMIGANRLSAVLFFGNPVALTALPRPKRMIVGCNHVDNNRYCVDALAGLIEPEGRLPLPPKFA